MDNGDKIMLRGLTFNGFHGVNPEDRAVSQRFLVDVDASTDLQVACISDHASNAIDHSEIYSIVKEVVEGASHNLLESIAHHIASNTLTKFHGITAVLVKVQKPRVPVPVPVQDPVEYLGVEIFRARVVQELYGTIDVLFPRRSVLHLI